MSRYSKYWSECDIWLYKPLNIRERVVPMWRLKTDFSHIRWKSYFHLLTLFDVNFFSSKAGGVNIQSVGHIRPAKFFGFELAYLTWILPERHKRPDVIHLQKLLPDPFQGGNSQKFLRKICKIFLTVRCYYEEVIYRKNIIYDFSSS